jgi:hypothetical protein
MTTTLNEAYALFTAIWHLKDWIANDTQLGGRVGEKTITDWVAQHGNYLGVVADLANGSKHAELNRKRWTDGVGESTRSVLVHAQAAGAEPEPQVIGARFEFTWFVGAPGPNRTWHETVDLADRAIGEWRAFLAAHGLRAPS